VVDAGDGEAAAVDFEAWVCGQIVEAERAEERELPLVAGGAAGGVGGVGRGRAALLPRLRLPLLPSAAEAIPVGAYFVDDAGVGGEVVIGR
jgi:hypothetical protein